MTEDYQFRLRPELPEGFVHNDRFPELPAMVEYLKPHEGKRFTSPEQFQDVVLNGFLSYLEAQQVPQGEDSCLRAGLSVERLPKRFEPMGFDCFVFTPASNGPGRCVLGGLEKMTQQPQGN
jgi:hypothetical protein